jgi:hypothetical protein
MPCEFACCIHFDIFEAASIKETTSLAISPGSGVKYCCTSMGVENAVRTCTIPDAGTKPDKQICREVCVAACGGMRYMQFQIILSSLS